MTETNYYWGYHLLLDCKSCNLDAIKSSENIATFVKELVTAIDMKAYGEPIIVNFGDDEKVSGYSLVQLIETSLISGHFVNQNGDAYIDIFSCKNYSDDVAVEVVQKYFTPAEIKSYFVCRQA